MNFSLILILRNSLRVRHSHVYDSEKIQSGTTIKSDTCGTHHTKIKNIRMVHVILQFAKETLRLGKSSMKFPFVFSVRTNNNRIAWRTQIPSGVDIHA
jgi:hypothetical protein